jgi:cyclomaltodextrinase / maltogenic alpha-amylase / neopullulanase
MIRLLSALIALLVFPTFLLASEVTLQLDMKQATDRPKTVHVAGSFNNWNSTATPLANNQDLWSVTLKLDEGQYQYKFVLDAGTPTQRWIEDPASNKDLDQPDGHGGNNSGVIVGPGGKKWPEAKADHINIEAIVFRRDNPIDLQVIDDKTARVRLRLLRDDVSSVVAHSWSGPFDLKRLSQERGLDVWGGVVPKDFFYFELTDGRRRGIFGANGFIPLAERGPAVANEVDDVFPVPSVSSVVTPNWARDAVWYQIFPDRFRNGDKTNDPGDHGWERLVPWNADWWADAPGETPPAGPTLEQDNFYRGTGDVWNRRYGGDIAGIREKLPYLRSLGVNAIYLNPVFEAESMHKYDTADFRHIDDNFGAMDAPREVPFGRASMEGQLPVRAGATESVVGTENHFIGNAKLYNLDGTPLPDDYVQTDDPATWKWTKSDLLFLDFLKDAHAQGFHVIIDGVFNHTGRAHPYFIDVLEKGKRSKYADWFEITDWGDEANWKPMDNPFIVHGKPGGIRWKAWDGDNGWLPVFKKSADKGLAPGPYSHIMAITKRWLDPDGNPATRDGIDGWRLDVPGDIPHPFWIDWRKVVKAANPDAYITGEIWTPAQPWINAGDQFDAVMNYQFAMAVQGFFANKEKALTPTQFNDRLVKLEYMYPFQSALVMQNLFDSHDTDRAPSWFVNPDRSYDAQNRPQDNARDNPYSEREPNEAEWARYKQMVAFQMTFVGAPMVYYGGEAGMWSPDDPSNRQPFPWDDKGPYTQAGVGFDAAMFAHYQRFIAIRNALPALRQGFYYPLNIDDAAGVLAFARSIGDDTVYVVLNRSPEKWTVELELPDAMYVDYAGPSFAVMQSNKQLPKPLMLKDDAGIKPTGGKLSLTLEPYGIAVLAKKP